LIWVLFFSGFSKDRKLIISAVVIVLSVLGFWFESGAEKPRLNVVNTTDLSNCGISVSHSYRSNFDFELCMNNAASQGDVTRLSFSLIASQCGELGECNELQRVQRDLSVDLPASESRKISFSEVNPDLQGIKWSLDIHSVKAKK